MPVATPIAMHDWWRFALGIYVTCPECEQTTGPHPDALNVELRCKCGYHGRLELVGFMP